MVRLKNITKLDKNVICDAYVEDCEVPIKLDLNINTKTMNDVIFPVGYEYCMSHIAHAKWKIIEMIENNQFPDNLAIMWY